MHLRRFLPCAVAATLLVPTSGCHNLSQEVAQLRAENARLEEENAMLRAGTDVPPPEFAPIQRLTVGLAAAANDFDEGAFEALLEESLGDAADASRLRLSVQESPREVAKIRGMLVQQYLAADEIPILISNLSFKLADASSAFKIGGTVVPAAGSRREAAGAGTLVTYRESLPGVLRRKDGGTFAIEYEELGRGTSSVDVELNASDMFAAGDGTRVKRQGDVSFNWRLNLAKVAVYQVEGFRGDVGQFLRQMRYGTAQSELGQFQTLQDNVFLFGYGSYRTDVVSQLRTPGYIDSVEVAPIDAGALAELSLQEDESQLLEQLGRNVAWQPCEPLDFVGSERTWRKPIVVGFPFVSRQTSSARGVVFYTLYSADGTRLLGNFTR